MDASLMLLLPMVPLLLLSGTFSGSETALFGLTVTDRLHLQRAHPAVAQALRQLLHHPRRLLITILLLNTTVNVLYFVLGSVIVLRTESAIGVPINIASLLALILFGEVLAKLLAGTNRAAFCIVVARPLLWMHLLFGPLLSLIDTLVIGPITRLLRPAPAGEPDLTLEELGALIDLGAAEGAIDQREQELLADVIEIGTVRVREVMTPRVGIQWLPADFDDDALRAVVATSGVDRIPICDGAVDHVIGMLETRDYLADRVAGRLGAVTDYLVETIYSPESATLDRLLIHFRSVGADCAVVVDEHGSVVGMVRIEDVAAHLVRSGGASTEVGAGLGDVRMVGMGRWSVPGRLSVRAWAGIFGQTVDQRTVTIGGLIVAILGRMPAVGDAVVVGNAHLAVESVSGRVVERVLIAHVGPGEASS